jgi:hypothetical protein
MSMAVSLRYRLVAQAFEISILFVNQVVNDGLSFFD